MDFHKIKRPDGIPVFLCSLRCVLEVFIKEIRYGERKSAYSLSAVHLADRPFGVVILDNAVDLFEITCGKVTGNGVLDA